MADEGIKEIARILRHRQTDAEKKMWRFLRSREFEGVKFRRQQPLGSYIADFCSHQARLIIEVDGSQHASDKGKDAKRTEYLNSVGYQVLRFWDNEVLNNMDPVLEKIRQHMKQIPLIPAFSLKGRRRKHNKPSPLEGEGLGEG